MPGSARADHRVLIIDDHVLFAESLELALSLGFFAAAVAAIRTMRAR